MKNPQNLFLRVFLYYLKKVADLCQAKSYINWILWKDLFNKRSFNVCRLKFVVLQILPFGDLLCIFLLY